MYFCTFVIYSCSYIYIYVHICIYIYISMICRFSQLPTFISKSSVRCKWYRRRREGTDLGWWCYMDSTQQLGNPLLPGGGRVVNLLKGNFNLISQILIPKYESSQNDFWWIFNSGFAQLLYGFWSKNNTKNHGLFQIWIGLKIKRTVHFEVPMISAGTGHFDFLLL